MATAVILAGGLSQRMGFDKQKLRVHDQALIKRQILILNKHFDHIIVISNNELSLSYEDLRGVEVYKDILKGMGPLGGIHAGLTYSLNDMIYVLACDMPNINEDYISYLSDQKDGYQAVVSQFGQWIEPFHGFYHKSLIKPIERYLIKGKRSIFDLLKHQNTCYIPEEIVRNFTPDWDLFFNYNTRDDLNHHVIWKGPININWDVFNE